LEQKEQPNTICKSVFKSGENITSKKQFTQIWIELINRMEKDKITNFVFYL
jgi:hypothetical protein